MTSRDAKRLADQAKGDFSRSILTKTRGMIFTYLYDKPLIDYLESDEQPEFIREISYSHKMSKNSSSDKEDLFVRDGTGKSYLLVTDQRIIYIKGAKDGDVSFEFRYSGISKVTASNENTTINIHLYQDTIIHSEGIINNPEQITEYIQSRIQESSPELEKLPAGEFYVKSSSARSGSNNDFCQNGDYRVEFHDKKLFLMSDSDDIEISFSSIASTKLRKAMRIDSGEFVSSGYHDNHQIVNPRYDTIRLTVTEYENPVHLYLITNMRGGVEEGFHGYIYPAIDRAFEHLRERTTNNPDTTGEKFVLNEWLERYARLKIQEWDDRSVSTGPSLEGSIETKGKSKGTQIGPFIRSKSKSESAIQIEDKSISVDSGGYTERISGVIVYEDRILVKTDPLIDVSYDEIERVMKRERGMSLIINGLTYTLERVRVNKEELENAIQFISRNIEESKSLDQSDSTDSTASTEQIRKLKELEEDGIISEEEFNSKKQELLDQI